MADPIIVQDIGAHGVNVDTNRLTASDNDVRQTQNATYADTVKQLGGLTKRPGLARFNGVSFAAPVLGGIEAPYAGVATAVGGGAGILAGQSTIGPESGTAPGDDVTFGTGQAQLQSSVMVTTALGNSDGPATLFNGRRLIMIGRDRQVGGIDNDSGEGWYLTSEEFQDPAWIVGDYDSPESIVGAGPPGACRQSIPSDPGHRAAPAASAIVDGWLYYAQQIVASSGVPATDTRGTIRRTNGYTDDVVARIERNPWNTDAAQANRVVSMLAADGGIYICTCDKGQAPAGETTGTNPDWGRIFFLDTGTNALTEVNVDDPDAPAGWARVPFTLAWYVDRLFFGGMQSDGTENEAIINYSQIALPPILDLKLDTPYFRTSCMAVYAGELFAGYQMRDTGVGVIDFAQVYGRVAAHATPGTSPWTSRLTASGGTAQAENRFVSMVVFKGSNAAASLYVSYFNNTQTAKIYKYDGTSWTTQYTASTTSTRAPLYLFVDKNGAGTEVLYAFGYSENGTMTWQTSRDGTTFTDRTSTLETVTVHSTSSLFSNSAALPIFFGFDQK